MNQATLEKLIDLAEGHQAADEYVAGRYEWENGACAIGCTIRDAARLGLLPEGTHPGNHAALAKINGVPELAWLLCDYIFEGLPASGRAAWTPRFLRAIRPEADYSSLPARVMRRLALKLASDAIDASVKTVCEKSAEMWGRRAAGEDPAQTEWNSLQTQAYAARHQADAALHQADAALQQAYAALQQVDAARHQADAAWEQAYAARLQADAASHQAGAAWEIFWKWCANMLCEELAKGANP